MITVIFEVTPQEGQMDNYLDIAAGLKEELAQVPGFISVERFQSLTTPGKLLSLSFFEDEEAVARWRNRSQHRAAQSKGRAGIFADYRIRVAQVMRDYTLNDREDVPEDSITAHS
jgi:heme-degrading monooxygenase HmoA